ncbi:NADP-specific glutamate dehydrogenase [Parasphaerochaeta coccoides]|uniref:Glutamate dehydrogenase n=1 Tax=Parasphaerochaeta coccoides (strain ATCC BAA-1237 / DSM 17374 / SPN1) TaxID=760011 RepID=F4GHR6_PARC1|nr:NADP-specific glutamate dehydrogenase [Parasphaerochaeta coccoides]AEC01604.1 glutamate dehydrogenase (NADP) [Parasphaerochaeta coccoides DSM 17374]
MHEYVSRILEGVIRRDPEQKEFHQAVTEFLKSVDSIIDQLPRLRFEKILERMVEPERIVQFRVPWVDDSGSLQINRGYRIQMSSALGPYKGGLRFHASVNLSVLKFLAFEQVYKNSLTGLLLGGGKGGSDFSPRGKSDREVMAFCQSFMTELTRHIGPDTDVPAGDIGVGAREIGYMFGQYKRLANEFTGVFTGKSPVWGGSFIRPEATGYGLVYFAEQALMDAGLSLSGSTSLVSGSGNVAQYTIEKLLERGSKPLTISDSEGIIYDPEGIDNKKLAYIKTLKNVKRGRVKEYADTYRNSVFTPRSAYGEGNPLWNYPADYAFPCATQNEINEVDARNLVANNIKAVMEGANMPTNLEAQHILTGSGVIFGPGKAANAGGVAVSGLEMAQNSSRLQWTPQEVDARLVSIMKNIYKTVDQAATTYAKKGDLVAGANIAGMLRVSDAMLAQGYV